MKNNLIGLLQARKNNSLYVEPIHAGEMPAPEIIEAKKTEIAGKNDEIFLKRLDDLNRKNNTWLLVLFIVIIALVIFLGIIIWKWQSNKDYLFGLLGGQGLSILFCINRLSVLYKKKRTSEILLYLYSSAQTMEEKNKIIDKMIDFLTR